jgi:hypothetical protein
MIAYTTDASFTINYYCTICGQYHGHNTGGCGGTPTHVEQMLMGWKCPQCQRIYSPQTNECFWCNTISIL